MSTYRDTFDRCPRCGISLTDARSARGCPQCGGLFVDEAILTEMIREMLPPGPLTRLQLAILQRDDATIGCPSCNEQMQHTSILEVPIDRCPKHGVWFDRDELGTALHRTGQPGAAPPLVEVATAPPRPAPAPTPPPAPSPPSQPSSVDPDARTITVALERPGAPIEVVQLQMGVVKIGRMASAHIRVDGPGISRMHAVIEVAETVRVIDLGSSAGTFVNGERVPVRALQSGDQIRIGDHVLTVTFAG